VWATRVACSPPGWELPRGSWLLPSNKPHHSPYPFSSSSPTSSQQTSTWRPAPVQPVHRSQATCAPSQPQHRAGSPMACHVLLPAAGGEALAFSGKGGSWQSNQSRESQSNRDARKPLTQQNHRQLQTTGQPAAPTAAKQLCAAQPGENWTQNKEENRLAGRPRKIHTATSS